MEDDGQVSKQSHSV